MFRCFPRPGGNASRSLWRLPHAFASSRGIKLSAMIQVPNNNNHRGQLKFSPEGWQRIEGLFAHNIGVYSELRPARRLDLGSINVRIGPRHTIQRFDMDCFTSIGRAYTEAVCRRYVAANGQPLWWSTKLVAQGKPVVRNKGSSRMNVAFRQAMRDAGYDVEGRRKKVPDGQQAQVQAQGKMKRGGADEPWRKTIAQLYGSVEICAHDVTSLHKMPFKNLQNYFAKVVRGLEEDLGRTADGSRAAPSEAQSGGGAPNRSNARGGQNKQKTPGRQPDQSQRPRPPPSNARNADAAGGKPQTAGGMRRLDLGRPAQRP
ncbi:hypothetical protein SLS53_005170 [Cytospora paraplurivora]|uniref:Uncharacterized protein n=1 Tax=Cytospora paraplurivora TaxID=2898453 RepID=A0AAN9U7V8_9PEZI